MNEQKNNGRGIFYGVIGVATLVVAIIGATFAYFTATESVTNGISGNMATISFGVTVEKIIDPGQTSGMIPMSNDMIEAAVNNTTNATCVDDNGNAVCQIYKITVTNTSSAAMFVDGYLALAGGSGTPTDYPTSFYTDNDKSKGLSMYVPAEGPEKPATGVVKNVTTMRWAQVFKKGEGEEKTSDYSTGGTQKLGYATENNEGSLVDKEVVTMQPIGEQKGSGTATGYNTNNIIVDNSMRGSLSISGSSYVTVAKNYIRVSNHTMTTPTADGVPGTISTSFDRSDSTSALVFSQQLQPTGDADGNNVAVYYVMVWLAETGTAQNPKTETSTDTNLAATAANFFNGAVTFNSAQGSEVTATFSGYTAVASDKKEQPAG